MKNLVLLMLMFAIGFGSVAQTVDTYEIEKVSFQNDPGMELDEEWEEWEDIQITLHIDYESQTVFLKGDINEYFVALADFDKDNLNKNTHKLLVYPEYDDENSALMLKFIKQDKDKYLYVMREGSALGFSYK